MSFARPKPPLPSVGHPPPASATAKKKTRAALTSSSSSSNRTASKVHHPTTASLAKRGQSSAGEKLKKKGPPLPAPQALKGEDAEALEAEEAYGDYVRAELLRLRAKEDYLRVKETVERECAGIWTAHSQEANSLRDAETKLDAIKFLSELVSRRRRENAQLRHLAGTLPAAAEEMALLARALERSQNYLKVLGAAVGDAGDAGKMIRAALEDGETRLQGVAVDRKARGQQEAELAELLSGLRVMAREALGAQGECAELLARLDDESVREASLQVGERQSRKLCEPGLGLTLPPPLPEPRLVDI